MDCAITIKQQTNYSEWNPFPEVYFNDMQMNMFNDLVIYTLMQSTTKLSLLLCSVWP